MQNAPKGHVLSVEPRRSQEQDAWQPPGILRRTQVHRAFSKSLTAVIPSEARNLSSVVTRAAGSAGETFRSTQGDNEKALPRSSKGLHWNGSVGVHLGVVGLLTIARRR